VANLTVRVVATQRPLTTVLFRWESPLPGRALSPFRNVAKQPSFGRAGIGRRPERRKHRRFPRVSHGARGVQRMDDETKPKKARSKNARHPGGPKVGSGRAISEPPEDEPVPRSIVSAPSAWPPMPGEPDLRPSSATRLTAARDRRLQLWIETYLAKPEWRLAEALAWIVFRDGRTAAEHLQYGESGLHTDHPDVVAAVMTLSATQLGAPETYPLDALQLELIKGRVQGLCDYVDGSNGTRAVHLDAAGWQYLKFMPEGPDGLTFIRDERLPRSHPLGRYVRVRFVRESVMQTFPSALQSQAAATETTTREPEPWRVRQGELQKQWITRPEVLDEAKRRCVRWNKSVCAKELEAMAELSGRPWKREAIRTALNQSGLSFEESP